MAANYLSGMFQPVVLNPQTGAITVADGYKAKFYEAGTDDAKTIYTNPDLSVAYPSPSNIAILDNTGKALIYLGPGAYKLLLTDADDVTVTGYPVDDILGAGGSGFAGATVNSFDDLKAINTNIYSYAFIGGYYSQGDGGDAMFYTGAAAAPNGGTIQDSTFDDSKSWYKIPDIDGCIRSATFGYIAGLGTDQTDYMQLADTYAKSIGAALRINGIYSGSAQLGSMTFTADVVIFDTGAQLKGLVSNPSWVFEGQVIASSRNLFNRFTAVTFQKNPEVIAEWVGVVGNGATDNYAAIQKLKASVSVNQMMMFMSLNGYCSASDPAIAANQSIRCVTDIFLTATPGTVYKKKGLYLNNTDSVLSANELLLTGDATVDNLISAGTITAPVGDITTVNSTTGNITTVNSTTANATTVNATTVNATGDVNADGDLNGVNANVTTVNATTVNATTVSASGNIDGVNITASASLAGLVVSSGTSLNAIAGTSGTIFKASGQIAKYLTPVVRTTTGTMLTANVPANAMQDNGDTAVYASMLNYAWTSGGSITITVQSNAQTIAQVTLNSSATTYGFAFRITRLTSTTLAVVPLYNGSGTPVTITGSAGASPNIQTTAVWGSGTDTLTHIFATIDIIPAVP